MSYTNEQLGKLLKEELNKGYDVIRLSRWASRIYFYHPSDLNNTQRDVLQELFRMEDDPQFEYTENELQLIAEMLINNEQDPRMKCSKKQSGKFAGSKKNSLLHIETREEK